MNAVVLDIDGTLISTSEDIQKLITLLQKLNDPDISTQVRDVVLSNCIRYQRVWSYNPEDGAVFDEEKNMWFPVTTLTIHNIISYTITSCHEFLSPPQCLTDTLSIPQNNNNNTSSKNIIHAILDHIILDFQNQLTNDSKSGRHDFFMWGILRPYAKTFVRFCFEKFDHVMFYTASDELYANVVILFLCNGYTPYRILTKKDCIFEYHRLLPEQLKRIIKPLHKIFHDPQFPCPEKLIPERVWYVDDRSTCDKSENTILIPEFQLPDLTITSTHFMFQKQIHLIANDSNLAKLKYWFSYLLNYLKKECVDTNIDFNIKNLSLEYPLIWQTSLTHHIERANNLQKRHLASQKTQV